MERVLLLRPYLEGAWFKIWADHDALPWISNPADASGKPATCRVRLYEFELNVAHHAGINHQAAVELLRLPTDVEGKTDLKHITGFHDRARE